jgi:regulator of ribonuclease activity A
VAEQTGALGMSPIVLPDLCDAHPELVRVAEPMFSNFGGRIAFGGTITTIKCFEDNSLVADVVKTPGEGRVLVVDAGGSTRCGMVGDNLAADAARNGWQGIVVYGCVRDVDVLAEIDVGIQALAPHPMKSVKRGVGERDLVVHFAGVSFVPGQYLYADNNGVLVSPTRLID